MIKLRSKHLACALLATTALATPALADDPDVVFIPPTRETVDENGVDLSTGFLTWTAPGISIGSGVQGLTYQRTLRSGWSNPYHYSVSGTPGTSLTVASGERSVEFTYSAGAYVNKQGTGETLTGSGTNWTFTMRDGTVVQMDASDFDPAADFYKAIAIARTITFPNKQKLTFAYKHLTAYRPKFDANVGHYRVQSVRSNTGYMAKLEYADNTTYGSGWVQVAKVTLLNNAVDYCTPTTDSCTFSKIWPSLTFTDDGAGTQTVKDALNNVTTYKSSLGVTTIRRPGSTSDNTTIVRDGTSKVSSITRDGRTWAYEWSLTAPDMKATITNPDGTKREIVTNTTINQIKSEKNERLFTTSYTYDAGGKGLLTDITYPEGNKVHYEYDARGNVKEKRLISKTPGTPPNISIFADYSPTCANTLTCNKPNWVKDANGNVINYKYDPTHGGVTRITRPAPAPGKEQPQTRYSYDTFEAYYKVNGNSITAGSSIWLPTGTSECQTGAAETDATPAACIGGVDEVKTSIDYGPQNGTANNLLPVWIKTANGNGTVSARKDLTYDGVGNVTYIDGPLTGTVDRTRIIYDEAVRRVRGQIGPDPDGTGSPLLNRAVRINYNPDGTVKTVERGTTGGQADADWTAFASAEVVDIKYDTSGRESSRKLSRSGTDYALSQSSYDVNGRLLCSAVRMNRSVYASLLASGQSACQLGAAGSDGPDRIRQVSYWEDGSVKIIEDAVGTPDQAKERSFTYTYNGLVQTLTDAENNKTTYVYDGFDRLSQTQYPSTARGAGTSSTTDYEQLTYDANSNVIVFRARSGGTIGFGYDALNRMVTKGSSQLADLTYSYDNLGRLLTAKFASGGQGITNSYDALGRLTSSTTDVGGTARSLSYLYDLAGRRTRLTWWDGFYVDYDRLTTGELSKVRENGATSGIGVLATYAYDSLGNRTSLSYGNGTATTYDYDPVSRLKTLTTDLAGTASDLTIGGSTTPMTYNPASEIISAPRSNDGYSFTGYSVGVSRPYTSNGLNQYLAAGPANFTYDANGNLIGDGTNTFGYDLESKLSSATVGGVSATLSYDPLNRLDVYNAGTSIRFIYDGGEVTAELDSSGGVSHRYVRGDGADELLVIYSDSSAASHRWAHIDERGSLLAQSDSTGAVQAINRYDEYGIPLGSNSGMIGYTGQVWLPEIGLYYYKARLYSPTLGRFMQTDPIGYGDDANLYAYVGNNPVNYADPLGLYSIYVTKYVNSPIEDLFRGNFGGNPISDAFGPGGLAYGSTGEPPFAVIAPRKRVQDRLRNGVCRLGNGLAYASDGLGKLSTLAATIGGPLTLFGAFTGNPAALKSGAAALKTAQVTGYGAAGTQFVSGLLQGATTGNYENAKRAAVGFGLDYLVGLGFDVGVPPADNTRRDRAETRIMMRALTRAGGISFGVIQQTNGGLSPIQVTCGGS